jgi:hypothetical protein
MRHISKPPLIPALAIAALFAAVNVYAFRGIVQTDRGTNFEGEIRLEKNAFSITDTNGVTQRVTLDQLVLLRAQERPKSIPLDPESDPNSKPTPEPNLGKRVPGIQLVGGSFIARRVHLADDTWIRFSDSPKEAPLSTLGVARIFFQPPTPEMEARLRPGRTGLLLKRNDFIESEFKGVLHGKIRVSSVLFGLKNFEPAQVQVLALRDPKLAPAKYTVRTFSDSCYRINGFLTEKDRLIIQDPAMAGLQVSASELAEIRKLKD